MGAKLVLAAVWLGLAGLLPSPTMVHALVLPDPHVTRTTIHQHGGAIRDTMSLTGSPSIAKSWRATSISSPRRTSFLCAESPQEEATTTTETTITTPMDRPLLALVDVAALMGFAAIGKASHNASDGSINLGAVLQTALPFLVAWLAMSPLTGVYQPTNRKNGEDSSLMLDTARQVATGWVVAIPLGCVGRGLIKGYIPPTSFVIVTLIATLVILTGARLAFFILEDFFVELVN